VVCGVWCGGVVCGVVIDVVCVVVVVVVGGGGGERVSVFVLWFVARNLVVL